MSPEKKQEKYINMKKHQEDMKNRMGAYQKKCGRMSHPAAGRHMGGRSAGKE